MTSILYSLNDLPKFSPWPARLLGIEEWEKRNRTLQDLRREYGSDKWGKLLSRLRKTPHAVSRIEVDRWYFGEDKSVLCSIDDEFVLMPVLDAQQKYLDFVGEVLESFLPASALVELGAGYGSVLLAMGMRSSFTGLPLLAGEYTDSGLQLIQTLAQTHEIDVTTGHCDFTSDNITDLPIPPGAIIYTSYAASVIPRLGTQFLPALLAFKPKVVVFIEPCYEHCDPSTLLGLMRRRYIEVNDYNTNLLTLLWQAQELGMIRIVQEEPMRFGMNPLFAASVVAFSPSGVRQA